MNWFSKLRSKLSPSPVTAQSAGDNGGKVRPFLRFKNERNPEGPHAVEFDELRRDSSGNLVLILDMQGSQASAVARHRPLLALDAIAQNEDALCCVLMREADLAAFDSFIQSTQVSHRAALERVQIAVG